VVDDLAAGNAAVINKAGLLARGQAAGAVTTPQKVSGVTTKPGKLSKQAVLNWPASAGRHLVRLGGELQPEPGGPWTALGTGAAGPAS